MVRSGLFSLIRLTHTQIHQQTRTEKEMLLFYFLLFQVKCDDNEIDEPEKFKPLKAYLIGLTEKRKTQLDFVLKMAKNKNHGKMAKMTYETVVETIRKAEKELQKVDFTPDILTPKDGQKRNLRHLEAVSQLYENVALLGDFARRLPHLLVELYAQSSESDQTLIRWAFDRTEVKFIF